MARTGSNPARTLLTVIMNVLIAWAVIVLVHLVVVFFGVLSHSAWGVPLLKVTRFTVLPLPVPAIPTPYGGIFDVAAAATVLIVVVAEWILGAVRRAA